MPAETQAFVIFQMMSVIYQKEGNMERVKGSKTIPVIAVLSVAGGFLDAYTYFMRGGVFANAQTGNVVRLGLALAEHDRTGAVHYLLPILAFVAGVSLSMFIDRKLKGHHVSHRAVLAAEALILFTAGCLPQSEGLNNLCNIMVSFICAMQMEAFRDFAGHAVSTVVVMGNMRSMTENFFDSIQYRDRQRFKAGMHYFLIIMCFLGGVILGTEFSEIYGIRAVMAAGVLQITAVMLISLINYRYGKISA